MANSDSFFLFEVIVEELKSFIDCNEFYIKGQFADLFNINLKDPNDLDAILLRPRRKNPKRKSKVRNSRAMPAKAQEPSLQFGQSILLATDIETLMLNMKLYPMELSLWDKDDTENRLGSTHIPWRNSYIDYLNKLCKKVEPPPVVVTGAYNVFDEYTSRCMANIKLTIKLSYFKDNISTQFRKISDDNQRAFIYTGFDHNSTTVINKEGSWEDPGVIKTIYNGGKQNLRKSSPDKRNNSPEKAQIKKEVSINQFSKTDNNKNAANHRRSDTDVDGSKQMDNAKSKSCSSIGREQINILDYIFNDDKAAFGNQVYCVNYFTIDNDLSTGAGTDSASAKPLSSEKSLDSKARYHFKVCSDDCKKADTNSDSVCSLDLPSAAAHLITVGKCKHITCDNKPHKQAASSSDDRILLDLSSLKKDCCDTTEKVEEVVGGMTAKMKINANDPCYCECECKFGFVKRTQYCNVCGGYEVSGEDLGPTPGHDEPFPCPIYHKLDKKKTYSNSGSESKKKDSKSRSVADKSESERDCNKKGKKRKIDERFKFNYGYTGIPPKIGHSQCGFPCTGTMGNVPKNMGWLWTADNVPGLKEISLGWKPGAISKRLLRKLNKAKQQISPIQRVKTTKKAKKHVEDKPTLTISKINGEYRVEMQVSPKNSDTNIECSPLVYKIARADNEDRIKQRERKQRRLVREAVSKVWKDPYHPEVCEKTCLKAYKQAIGLLPYDPNKPECICSDKGSPPQTLESCSCEDVDVSSECSSLELDWEIHFTPPNAYHV